MFQTLCCRAERGLTALLAGPRVHGQLRQQGGGARRAPVSSGPAEPAAAPHHRRSLQRSTESVAFACSLSRTRACICVCTCTCACLRMRVHVACLHAANIHRAASPLYSVVFPVTMLFSFCRKRARMRASERERERERTRARKAEKGKGLREGGDERQCNSERERKTDERGRERAHWERKLDPI
jgi:hypothetical protein